MGEPCDGLGSCTLELFCEGTTDTCKVPRADGQPCDDREMCWSGKCHVPPLEVDGVCATVTCR
jgi:hypothetical protein